MGASGSARLTGIRDKPLKLKGFFRKLRSADGDLTKDALMSPVAATILAFIVVVMCLAVSYAGFGLTGGRGR